MKQPDKTVKKRFSWPIILTVLFVGWFFLSGLTPPKSEAGFDLDGFSRLPIKFGGRKKPIDTFARNLLTVVSGRSVLRTDAGRVSATAWLLEALSGVPEAEKTPVFRIDHPDLISNLGLKQRKGFRYTYREVWPRRDRLDRLVDNALEKPADERDAFDRQVLKTANRIYLYQHVLDAFGSLSFQAQSLPLVIPPQTENASWEALANASGPLAAAWRTMLSSRQANDSEGFNTALHTVQKLLKQQHPAALKRLNFELFYNRLSCFLKSAELYLLCFLLALWGWASGRQTLFRVARAMMLCTFFFHTFGLIARMFLSGYPPVTNLYSSAIFIGWAAVLSGLLLEFTFRLRSLQGMGLIAGSIAGFCTLLVAHFLSGDGDTLEQMRAVLDTRFWLATHVITISLGYMAAFLAGTLAAFRLLLDRFSRRLDSDSRTALDRTIYGVACFTLFFSFLGTVLGGLWADDSWGRFWGWDPKENGALLIVLWFAVMLHARAGRMIGPRGFAAMALLGNGITAWSWFGVNQLGVGLHSYGFTDSAAWGLTLFICAQLVLLGLSMLPKKKGQKEPKTG